MGAAYPQLFLKRGDLPSKASTRIKIDVNTIGAHEKKGVTVTGPLHEIDPLWSVFALTGYCLFGSWPVFLLNCLYLFLYHHFSFSL